MKKLFRGLLLSVAFIMIIMGVSFCGLKSTSVNTNSANASETELGIIRIDMNEMFKIGSLEFIYNGAVVEFGEERFEFSENKFDVRITVNTGEDLAIINSCERFEDAGGGKLYYYLTQEELVSGFGLVVEGYEFPAFVPADKNTPVKITVVADDPTSETFTSYYFSKIKYSAITSVGTKYNIFSPVVDNDGNVSVGGTYEPASGLYTNNVNGRTFKSNFKNEDGGELTFVVGEADNIVLFFEADIKAFPVYVNGVIAVDDGDLVCDMHIDNISVSVPVKVEDYNSASLIFIPDSGKLIKKVQLTLGSSHQMFTIYGGVYDEPVSGSPVYYFPTGVDTTGAIKGSCGNYAFALVNEDSNYNYRFYGVSETHANYAEFAIYDDEAPNPSPNKNQYTIRVYEDGRVKLLTSSAVSSISVEIESQSFAKIEVRHTTKAEDPMGEDYDDVSSDGLEWLKVNGVVMDTEGAVPKTLFLLDYEDSLQITTKLKLHNNYYNMDMNKIDGDIFEDVIGLDGGVLVIHTINEETTYFRIQLLNPDGSPYTDIYTKVYIAVHETDETLYASAEELMANVVPSQMVATSGEALVEGLYSEYYLQYVIKISPYKIIADAWSNETVLVYSDLSVQPSDRDGNTTEGFVVKNFEVVKPVFHNGEKIGDLKISLISYAQTKAGPVLQEIAVYDCLFKQVGSHIFETITPSNPYLRGYDFSNMRLSDSADGFLTKFVDAGDGYFGINTTDTEVHRLLSSRLYFAVEETPEEGDVFIEPMFDAQLIEFEFSYADEDYVGKAYFDDNKIYLDKVFDPKEAGRYLAGIKYTFESGGTGWVKILEVEYPELVTEGEFEGLYMYELDGTTPWDSHEPDALYEAQVDLRTYYVKVVSIDGEKKVCIIEKEILFESDFVVDDIEGLVAPIYPNSGIYNHIGWIEELDEDINFVVTDELEGFIKIKTPHTYLWEYNVRLVPVFSANVVSVRFYDEGELLASVNVKSNEVVNVEQYFINPDSGEFYAPSKFGYKFIGFTRDSVLALKLEFDGFDNYYSPILADNEDIFTFDDPNFLWIASSNIDFHSVYEEVGYQLFLEIDGAEYANPADFTSKISGVDSSFYYEGSNVYSLSGFNITDEIYMTGFRPNTEDAYIALIEFGYRNVDGITYEDGEFFTICDANGVLTSQNDGTRFDEGVYTITLIVNELINADTEASAIYVRIVYKPVTVMISFSANIVKGVDDVIYNDPASNVYYKVTRADASIDKVDNWIVCDEHGTELGKTGWQDIVLPETNLIFMKNSLNGIAGVYYKDRNVTYSFKAWIDLENGVELDGTTDIRQGYNFLSTFSDEFDITVNYYIYNDSLGNYYKDSFAGYFWMFDGTEYTLEDVISANTFEIYLIGGELYYISHWTQRLGYELIVGETASDIPVMTEYEIGYSPNSIVIDFYAVYNEYDFSVDKEGNTYTGLVSVPNDPNGNSYSSADVYFITVNKTRYDVWTSSEFRTIDRLNSLFASQEEIDAVKVHSYIVGSVTIDPAILEENYLFAVVQRKVNGENIPSFYLALLITI